MIIGLDIRLWTIHLRQFTVKFLKMRFQHIGIEFAPQALMFLDNFIDGRDGEAHFGVGIDEGQETAEICIIFEIFDLRNGLPNQVVFNEYMCDYPFVFSTEGRHHKTADSTVEDIVVLELLAHPY